jgi:hypothetical protein
MATCYGSSTEDYRTQLDNKKRENVNLGKALPGLAHQEASGAMRVAVNVARTEAAYRRAPECGILPAQAHKADRILVGFIL